MHPSTYTLLTVLLRDVSRSFYTTLRVLPGTIRPQISLAYLLARTTDTIADTEIVSLDQRLQALRALRERILGTSHAPLEFGELAQHQGSSAERSLLERCEEALSVLSQFTPADQQLIRDVLAVITSGQELDVQRFAGANARNIIALKNDVELDDYTYRVAGCVGEFWTKICRAHLFPDVPLDDAFLLTSSARFGKGLQLVNILRDVAVDLRQGRCYLPRERLAACGLTPADLLQPACESAFRPLFETYLAQAESHLEAGWAYTDALPRSCVRVRLACAWPILIGVKTLGRLRNGNVLDPQQKIKITRAELRKTIVATILNYPWRSRWNGLFAQAHV